MCQLETLRRRISFSDDRLCWAVIGERGAIHVWCFSTNFTLGGIEIHSKTPIYEGHEPNKDSCWLIGDNCHHDGSGLQYSGRIRFDLAEEFSRQIYGSRDETPVWDTLLSQYQRRFGCEAGIDFDTGIELQSEIDKKEKP